MRMMISRMIGLLALVAVLLMPFGMTAPAAAAHHDVGAATSMQHCPDEQPPTDAGIAQCTMACAAALPGIGAPSQSRLAISCASPAASAPRALHGIQQDIATPPPKRS